MFVVSVVRYDRLGIPSQPEKTHDNRWSRMKPANLRGKRFGRLVALSRTRGPDKRMRWKCRCDCGAIVKNVRTSSLLNGNTKSCGCSRAIIRRIAGATYRHGFCHRPEYSSYRCMVRRCYNPGDIGYKYYGGRGIKVCNRWLRDPNKFFEDVGPKPTKKHTIDRKDNDKNYAPGNVRWATRAEQNRNQRKHRRTAK